MASSVDTIDVAVPRSRRSTVPAAGPGSSAVAVGNERSSDVGNKGRQFDDYWQSRDLPGTDRRTRLRTVIVDSLLTHRDGRLLDVGCGRGVVAAYFAECGFAVTAIDISPLAVEWTHKQHPAIDTAVVDLEHDPIFGQYDVVVCLEVLQQVRDPILALSKLKDALAPGGEIFVSMPNEFHLVRRLRILMGQVDFGGIDDTHIKLYTPDEHRRLFARCGLRVTASRAQSIVPPRWADGLWHRWTNRLADRMPALFSLSIVYRVIPE